jgi:hypothetical protein
MRKCKYEIVYIKVLNKFTCYFEWNWNLIPRIGGGGVQIEGASEQGAEENICTQEGEVTGVEKITS